MTSLPMAAPGMATLAQPDLETLAALGGEVDCG
jgi:hypothetical protein